MEEMMLVSWDIPRASLKGRCVTTAEKLEFLLVGILNQIKIKHAGYTLKHEMEPGCDISHAVIYKSDGRVDYTSEITIQKVRVF